jgi:hypothetical protein
MENYWWECKWTAVLWRYVGSVKYHIAKRTRALQTGMIALSEKNMEWHKHKLRKNTDKVLIKAFGAARTEYDTSSDKSETSNYKPGWTICSALGP